ncbi:MAG: tetratricopeptide repeat protein, partial [Candidatus Promineifilaceae bacterium]
QYDASLTARRQAWLAARQARDVTRTIKTGYNLGILYIQREQFDNAQRHLSESQALAQEAGNGRMTALCNKALGGSYVLDGKRYEQALPFYDAAYTHFKHSGNQWWLATICYDLVEVLVMLGRLGEAMAYLQEGEAMMLPNTKSAEIYASLRKQFFELSAEFTPRQRQIIHHVRVNKRIDKRTCHTLLDISTTQALRELTELVEQNILQRIGKGRGTHYTFNPAFLSPHEDI